MSKPTAISDRVRVQVVVGTRPEAIKLAPVVRALGDCDLTEANLISTGQHGDLVRDILTNFEIEPDQDLGVIRPGHRLTDLLARCVDLLGSTFRHGRPDLVLVQGDTISALAGAMAAYYEQIPVGHVEAGLRSGNFEHPFPEEANRVLISRLSRLHFAPTRRAAENLLSEEVERACVFVCGNTVIDALGSLSKADLSECDVSFSSPRGHLVHNETFGQPQLAPLQRRVLVTAHRRENWGDRFQGICRAVRRLAEAHGDVQILFVTHPNPKLQETANAVLGRHPCVVLSPPLPYARFISALARADIILTDSGGVQEEASALGKPVLLLRETTERPEGVESGNVRVVGSDEAAIVAAAQVLLCDPIARERMAQPTSCFGDGLASQRIVQAIAHFFGRSSRPVPFDQPLIEDCCPADPIVASAAAVG